MSDNILLIVAISVFTLMAIGLVLTYLEFKHGAPKKQDEKNEKSRDITDDKL